MAPLKYSRQREAIRHELQARCDHPTAEMIYDQLRGKEPHLSMGTVYRNLALLSEMGEIRRIPVKDGPDRFDGDITGHGHFICRLCHRVYDLHLQPEPDYAGKTVSCMEGSVEEITLNVYGVCRSCGQEITKP